MARPVQKLFNEDNIRAIGGEINNDGDFLIFEGARYSRKGGLEISYSGYSKISIRRANSTRKYRVEL